VQEVPALCLLMV